MEFEKKNSFYKTIMIIIVTAIVTFLCTGYGLYYYYINTDEGNIKILSKITETSSNKETEEKSEENKEESISTKSENVELDSKLKLVDKYLEKYSLWSIDEETNKEMIESAVSGYIEGLGDPYTAYLDENEYNDLMIDVTGNYTGIGIYMAQDVDGNIVVLTPIEGSPAEEAGLKTGDYITKVNGKECTGTDITLVSNEIKGEEGTTVELEILREGETFTKVIQRKNIEIAYIKSEVLEGNIGYIRLLTFDSGALEEFNEHLEKLKQQGITSLILDIRDNGGGIVDECTGLADLFLEKDNNIMITVDKNNNQIYEKAKDDSIVGLKTVVLINENSASASEILAGALQDNKAATIIGETSFGKGIMQEIFPLTTGGALKITISEFRTPNGNVINEKGITPDIEIEDNEETDTDEQLQKAIEFLK